ncbi:serine hydrolase [Rhizobium sp.]|uniref:serine hydrolase domain-containing protein n=1 Tax=Rhizobium sp. TaxID=391 RepID=UPI0028AE9172
MKSAATALLVSTTIFLTVSPALSDQEPKKNLVIEPPRLSTILPLQKIPNPNRLTVFCGVTERCSLREYQARFGVCGLYVLKNGTVRIEMFNNSQTIRCQEDVNGIDKMFGVASVTKSITSTLLAQVLSEKYHPESKRQFERILGRSVGSFLGEDDRKAIETGYAEVKLHNILEMRSGIAWREEAIWPFVSDSRRFDERVREPPRKENLLEFAASYKLNESRVREFRYSALDAAMAIPVAASSTHDKDALAAFERGVWSMIGAKHSARWNVDRNAQPIGPCCFRARIDDLARFGDFVLNKGKGKIPAAWFDLATARTSDRFVGLKDESGGVDASCRLGYGYFWWLRQGRQDFTAYGHGGQFVHIYPKERIVIVQMSDWILTRVSDQARCTALKTHDEIVRQLR